MSRFIQFSIAFLICWLAPILFLVAIKASVPSTYISEQLGSTLVAGIIAYAFAIIITKKGKPTSVRLFFFILIFIQVALFASKFGVIH